MKRTERTELTVSKILEAAMAEFGANGYAGGTVNNICKSGINKGLIYHNFKDKDELYLVCLENSCKKLVSMIEESGCISDQQQLPLYIIQLILNPVQPLLRRLVHLTLVNPGHERLHRLILQRRGMAQHHIHLPPQLIQPPLRIPLNLTGRLLIRPPPVPIHKPDHLIVNAFNFCVIR